MQLRFAPPNQRRKQLYAAERLFEVVDKDKEYPFEFVCFRITGFHPKSGAAQQLIKGDELAEDLRFFISKLSGQFARPVAEQDEKVYKIEELAKAFNVSTKTIHRWRKRGLIGRKFVFNDGKKLFGFLQSDVDKFARENPDLTTKAKTFGRMTNKQKQQIIRQAAKLAATTKLTRHQVIKKIVAKFDKAHETVRYTLLNYEKDHPDKPIFKRAAGIVEPATAGEIYKLFKQGRDVRELMKRFNRSRSSIYRIINARRTRALLGKRIKFVASEEFLGEDAREKILSKPLIGPKPTDRSDAEPFELVGELLLPKYLQTLKDTPILNRERELELFRRYNYLKFLACERLAGIKSSRASRACLAEIESYLDEAETVKKMIIEANLRLVVSIACKHVGSGADFIDFVSRGNFSLVKSVDEFDYTRGRRFSSHLSWAIAKDYARKTPVKSRRLDKATAARLANIRRDLQTAAEDLVAVQRERRSLVQVIKDNLDAREQYVILNRFGPIGSPIKKKTKTLKQIGEEVGLSKERVRQIELTALQKLRQSLSSKEFELLTG